MLKLKNFIQKNSDYFSFLKYCPFSLRLGKEYKVHQALITSYNDLNSSEKLDFHYLKLKQIIEFAYNNIQFYKTLYDENDFSPIDFKSLNDFNLVPIVKKSDLKKFILEKRSFNCSGRMLINTGGTSGEPLSFFLDKNAFAREWAYMHNIWAQLGYNKLDLKLTFRGKKNRFKSIEYNVIHNEYVVDAYCSYDLVINDLNNILKRNKIKYLHGYPSAIYEFCQYAKLCGINLVELFNGHLKGVFLGSEFPLPQYREVIESQLQAPTISWYGHSEMSVLATECAQSNIYVPYQTYGYTESVPDISLSENRLICTSYYNTASPFIRYDTGDFIKNEAYIDGVLNGFSISSGREGDFVIDKNGKRLPLTALIFGRHHKAFDVSEFIQVYQPMVGFIQLFITSSMPISMELFDFNGVDMSFDIVLVSKPIKTINGKVPLLITDSLLV